MKTVNAGLQAALSAGGDFLLADLYTFYFREGTQRWTSADTHLAYPANLLTYSEQIGGTNWNKTNVTVSLGYDLDPAETEMSATRVTASVSGHNLNQVVPVLPSTTYTFSFYAKNNGGSAAQYSIYDWTNTTSIVAQTNYFPQINGSTWTRISCTFTTPATCTSVGVYPLRDGGPPVDILLWGAQLDHGATATTYAATTATAGTTFYSTGPTFTRGQAKASAGLSLDTMDIQVVPGSITLAGNPMKQAALLGSFNQIQVQVHRAFMATWGTIIDTALVFDGVVVDVDPGSTEINLTVKSQLAKVAQQIPKRLIQPQCPFRVYDTDCGLAVASWTHARTAAAGSTATVVKLSATSTNANVGGYVQFTSGTLAGTYRTVKAVSGVDLTLNLALPSVPVTGVGLNVVKGCDKTRTGCRTFSNIARFGGFPDSPKPEAVK